MRCAYASFQLSVLAPKRSPLQLNQLHFHKSLGFCAVFKRFWVVILQLTLMEDTWQIHITFNVLETGFVHHLYASGGLFQPRLTLRWTNPDVGQVEWCGKRQGLFGFMSCAEQSLDSFRTDQWEPWQMTPRHGLEGVRKLCGLRISLPLWW